MIYTSGTTGRPKGVKRRLVTTGAPLETMKLVAESFAQILSIPEGGRSLLVGPVYHSAQWLWSYVMLCAGRSVVMRRSFDPEETLRLIEEHRITNVHLVPTQFVRLLRLDEETRRRYDLSGLAAVWHGAAPCSPEVKRQMIDWFGPILYEYYGSTESSVNTIVSSPEWLERPGTVGRALPTTEIHVLREDGSPAATGSAANSGSATPAATTWSTGATRTRPPPCTATGCSPPATWAISTRTATCSSPTASST